MQQIQRLLVRQIKKSLTPQGLSFSPVPPIVMMETLAERMIMAVMFQRLVTDWPTEIKFRARQLML